MEVLFISSAASQGLRNQSFLEGAVLSFEKSRSELERAINRDKAVFPFKCILNFRCCTSHVPYFEK